MRSLKGDNSPAAPHRDAVADQRGKGDTYGARESFYQRSRRLPLIARQGSLTGPTRRFTRLHLPQTSRLRRRLGSPRRRRARPSSPRSPRSTSTSSSRSLLTRSPRCGPWPHSFEGRLGDRAAYSQICSHLQLGDLVQLASTSRALRQLLLSPSAGRQLWARVRRESGYVVPDGMDDISFALLLEGKNCQVRTSVAVSSPLPRSPASLHRDRTAARRSLRQLSATCACVSAGCARKSGAYHSSSRTWLTADLATLSIIKRRDVPKDMPHVHKAAASCVRSEPGERLWHRPTALRSY